MMKKSLKIRVVYVFLSVVSFCDFISAFSFCLVFLVTPPAPQARFSAAVGGGVLKVVCDLFLTPSLAFFFCLFVGS
jgi:hypothetical protein